MQPVCYNYRQKNVWPGTIAVAPAVSHRRMIPVTSPDSTPDSPVVKVCTICGEIKSAAELVRSSRRPDGYAARCKACHNAWNREIAERDLEATRAYGRAKARRMYRKHGERWRARHREWYAENREHAVAYAAEYQRAHPEKKAEHDRAYARRNSTAIVARVKAWQVANPERTRAHRSAAKAKRRGAGESRSFDRAAIWDRDGGRCHICGKKCDPKSWDMDHLIPLSRGGSHTPDNVSVSHPECNRRRFNTGPAQLRLGGEI